MKAMRSLLMTFMLFGALSWYGCYKAKLCPDTELPSISMEGENTFGCRVDGEAWVPYVKPVLIDLSAFPVERMDVNYDSSDGECDLSVTRLFGTECDTTLSTFDFIIQLDSIENHVNHLEISYENYDDEIFYRHIDSTQAVTFDVLKYDREEKVLACTFAFTLYNEETGERVKITDGRFDIDLTR